MGGGISGASSSAKAHERLILTRPIAIRSRRGVTMLLDLTISHLTVLVGEHRATIQGELCQVDDERMGFVIYTDTMVAWDAPHQDCALTDSDRAAIIEIVSASLATRGQVLLRE